MVRCMQLIFKILNHIEQQRTETSTPIPEFKGFTMGVIKYHVELCLEANYIRTEGNLRNHNYRLTWEGHEALDRFRENDEEYSC